MSKERWEEDETGYELSQGLQAWGGDWNVQCTVGVLLLVESYLPGLAGTQLTTYLA